MSDLPELRGVLRLLAESRGLDFRDYHPPQLARALQARMAAAGVGNARDYQELLANDPLERERLVSALVVSVTRMFRDADVFDALGAALRKATAGPGSPSAFRAWGIGAATGEEAWSLAALLEDTFGEASRFQVLATDIDRASLAVARVGEYPRASLQPVPDRYRRSFATTDAGVVVVAPRLRAHVTFATHDIVGATLAPPEALVASFRLVLLRNVLIYFDRRLQEKALERVRAVLEPGGMLVLGRAESLPLSLAHDLQPHPDFDERLRIYRRR